MPKKKSKEDEPVVSKHISVSLSRSISIDGNSDELEGDYEEQLKILGDKIREAVDQVLLPYQGTTERYEIEISSYRSKEKSDGSESLSKSVEYKWYN